MAEVCRTKVASICRADEERVLPDEFGKMWMYST